MKQARPRPWPTGSLTQFLLSCFSRLSTRRSRHAFFFLVGAATMLVWDWKLLLATLAGGSATVALYLLPHCNWRSLYSRYQQALSPTQRQFILAGTGSGVAAIATYMAAAIWETLDNHWLAVAFVLQGGAIFIICVALVRQWQGQDALPNLDYDRLLGDLAAPTPLPRLLAIRRLTQFALQDPDPERGDRLAQYLQMLLLQETEPCIRDAAIESIQRLAAPIDPLPPLQPLPRRQRPVYNNLAVEENPIQATSPATELLSWIGKHE